MTISPEMKLIETMLREEGAYFLQDLHMARLKKSAGELGFSLDETAALSTLERTAAGLDPEGIYRIRLLLDKTGGTDISVSPLERISSPVKLAVSEERTDRNDPLLRHKTTDRGLYDSELAKYRVKGFFDCVFLNREDEVTECAISNIFIRKGDDYFTPPLSSGVLPGVYREYLFLAGELPLAEKVLHPEDIAEADELFIANSVRKMLKAVNPFSSSPQGGTCP